jgi:hypothetical protein
VGHSSQFWSSFETSTVLAARWVMPAVGGLLPPRATRPRSRGQRNAPPLTAARARRVPSRGSDPSRPRQGDAVGPSRRASALDECEGRRAAPRHRSASASPGRLARRGVGRRRPPPNLGCRRARSVPAPEARGLQAGVRRASRTCPPPARTQRRAQGCCLAHRRTELWRGSGAGCAAPQDLQDRQDAHRRGPPLGHSVGQKRDSARSPPSQPAPNSPTIPASTEGGTRTLKVFPPTDSESPEDSAWCGLVRQGAAILGGFRDRPRTSLHQRI